MQAVDVTESEVAPAKGRPMSTMERAKGKKGGVNNEFTLRTTQFAFMFAKTSSTAQLLLLAGGGRDRIGGLPRQGAAHEHHGASQGGGGRSHRPPSPGPGSRRGCAGLRSLKSGKISVVVQPRVQAGGLVGTPMWLFDLYGAR